jgi:hypothetical protein
VTDPRNAAAPGTRGTGGNENDQGRSEAIVGQTGDKADNEMQLLGCMLRCGSAAEIQSMTYAVPARVFSDRLTAALWLAGEHLANNNVADAATTVKVAVMAGLWPRDLHHEVTSRAVDAIEASKFDPWEWPFVALQVLDAHLRRETARRLSLVAADLPNVNPRNIVRDLLDAVEYAETVLGWMGHIDRQELAA